jgi:hypothetical protein
MNHRTNIFWNYITTSFDKSITFCIRQLILPRGEAPKLINGFKSANLYFSG